MHELAVTRSILDTVLTHTRGKRVQQIVRIHLVVGELNEFKRKWIQRYFDHLSKGTVAEGAYIAVEQVPTAFRCQDCGLQFESEIRKVDRIRCLGCSGTNLVLERGREFLIRDMEVK